MNVKLFSPNPGDVAYSKFTFYLRQQPAQFSHKSEQTLPFGTCCLVIAKIAFDGTFWLLVLGDKGEFGWQFMTHFYDGTNLLGFNT